VQFSVNAFDEPAYCSALVQCLSTERFEQYLIRCANDMPRALRLYFFNTSLSAELFQAISVLEVGLRNAMHRELSKQFGSEWYDRHDIGLSPESLRLTANAIRYFKDRRKEVSPGRVVAGLTLAGCGKMRPIEVDFPGLLRYHLIKSPRDFEVAIDAIQG
jgi:hypothetical protein